MKDLVLFAVSFYLLSHDVARTSVGAEHLQDGLPSGTRPLHVNPANYLRLRDQLSGWQFNNQQSKGMVRCKHLR
jgi:hypothetical protein